MDRDGQGLKEIRRKRGKEGKKSGREVERKERERGGERRERERENTDISHHKFSP